MVAGCLRLDRRVRVPLRRRAALGDGGRRGRGVRDGRRRKKVRDALGPGGRRRSVNRRREHRAGLRLARAHDVYSCKGKNSIRDRMQVLLLRFTVAT